MARAVPNVLTIPPGDDFAARLVEGVLDGTVLGQAFGTDPLALAELTIYVPTQRIRRAIEVAFAEALAPRPAILPRIRPLAEPGDPVDRLLGNETTTGLIFEPASLKPVVSPLERQFLLRPDIDAWRRKLRAARGEAEPASAIARAADFVESLGLANALGQLIDEMMIAGLPLSRLASVAPEDFDPAAFDEYWAHSRDFLRLAAQGWPKRLQVQEAEDAATQRLGIIKAEAERLERLDPASPIIVAGSTGSVHATAQLMREVARLDNGAVVLPGFDLALAGADPGAWRMIGSEWMEHVSQGVGQASRAEKKEKVSFATRFAHPQVSLKRTIEVIEIPAEAIRQLGTPQPDTEARNRFISEALRPAEATGGWRALREGFPIDAALAGLSVIEAKDEREEALAIAILMRETLETQEKSVALVTPDRAIATRVKAELRRWGIVAEDSAGTRLGDSPAGSLLRLLLDAAEMGDGVSILTLLRHPKLRLGLELMELAALTDALEILVLRGRNFMQGLPLMERALHALGEADRRLPPPGKRVSDATRAALPGFAHMIDDTLAPFRHDRADATLADCIALLGARLETLARLPDGTSTLDGDAAFGSLRAMFEDITLAARDAVIPVAALRGTIEAMLADRIDPTPRTTHPRAAILGMLEARLLGADRVILAGLNEGTFPPAVAGDPFLNRAMRVSLGLSPPEWRIGQSAHDFTMLAGHPDLVLTRAARNGGQPGIPSRFLRRMKAFAGEAAWAGLVASGAKVLGMARALDAPGPFSPIAPPDVVPDMPRLPARLSITEIETLRRDPYAIYAKHLLGLQPLDPLDPEPDARDRGSILHDVLEAYSRAEAPEDEAAARIRLRDLGTEAFRKIAHERELHRFWWQTFEAIIPGYLAFDRERRRLAAHILLEEHAEYHLPLPDGATLRLSGNADRLELGPDGRLSIIDYKSGNRPTNKTIQRGLGPQLTITAALAQKGAFLSIPASSEIDALAYLPIGGKKLTELSHVKPDKETLEDLIARDWARLLADLDALGSGRRGYRSRVAAFRQSEGHDYDHLARVKEWSLGGGEDAPPEGEDAP